MNSWSAAVFLCFYPAAVFISYRFFPIDFLGFICSASLQSPVPEFLVIPEPEFLNILKCNSAESVGTGVSVKFYVIFNDKILTVIIGFRPLFGSVKIDIKQIFYI